MFVPQALLTAFAVTGVVGVLSACAQPLPPPLDWQLSFSHLAPIRLDVSRVEVVDEYQPPLRPPNVEHEFPVTPASAAKRWATDRLRAVGAAGLARAIVREASVVEAPLQKMGGMSGLFVKEQSERYVAKLVIEIEIRSQRGYKDAFVRAEATRSRTVPENITLNEREKVYFELTRALLADINAELEKRIKEHLADYLR